MSYKYKEYSRKDLFSLPLLQFDNPDKKTFTSLFILKSKGKHESGFHHIGVIGINDGVPENVIALNSDIIDINDQCKSYDITYSIHMVKIKDAIVFEYFCQPHSLFYPRLVVSACEILVINRVILHLIERKQNDR